MSLNTLFAMPVWQHDFKDQILEELNQELEQCWPRLSYHPHTDRCKGLTTYDAVANDLPRNQLTITGLHIWQQVAAMFNALDCPPQELTIAQSWFNRYTAGDFEYDTEHARSVISGIYFQQVPKTVTSQLCFRNPNTLMHNNKWPGDQLMSYRYHSIPAVQGRMVIFPSWMTHSLAMLQGQGEIVTLEFNLATPIKVAELGPHFTPG